MNIIFLGSDDFAAVHLEVLIKSDHELLAIVCPPDKRSGRGMKTTAGLVKTLAQQNNITVLQPENVNDDSAVEKLKAFGADLFVVIAYGKILSQAVLDIPKVMPVNMHSSLLPKYRGAAPINWAIIHGETLTGISIIKMSKDMDAGDILAQKEIVIDDADTSVTLREKMKKVGPEFLLETVDNVGAVRERPLRRQNQKEVTLAPKLTKEMGRIDWHKPAAEIYNLIRGLQPWPGAYTTFKGKTLKILSVEIEVGQSGEAGQVLEADKNGILVATGKDALLIKDVHLESAKPMSVREFLAGHSLNEGKCFGDNGN